ncbi:MAG TPA: methyltransferase domain-containing protein [Novosphingobium sp.]|nr:methyltransferase domain-containing protein [Novosphingobium sp.]
MSGQNERVLDQFTQQASTYAALVKNQDSRPDPLVALLELQPHHRLLDVGCGSGQFAIRAAPLVAEVLGVDLTPAMLVEAREHARTSGVENIRWVQADSVALPVENCGFERVVSRSMFHHAADPGATLTEMYRACAPGGRMFVSDLSPDPAKGPAFDAIELLRDPSHQRALTLEELRELGRDRGLAEIVLRSGATSLPLETVLATSFPPPGMLDHVRSLLERDAARGTDIFGLRPEMRNEVIWVSYPTMIVGWEIPR